MTALAKRAAISAEAAAEAVYDRTVTAADFRRMFGLGESPLPDASRTTLARLDTRWGEPARSVLEDFLLDVVRRLDSEWLERSPDENRAAFERGWRENLTDAVARGVTAAAVKPRYFRPSRILRYSQTLIAAANPDLEHGLFTLARQILFTRYLAPYSTIHEMGCGSCANLLMLNELLPGKRLIGSDWTDASVEIARLMAVQTGAAIDGCLLNLLAPPLDVRFEPGTAVLTVHALEQLGDRHGPLLEFLIRARPALVLNYEPVLEFYDPDNLYDYLALRYSHRRGYLSGYYTALLRLAQAGRIELVEARRPCLGGVYHESSVLVWRPL